MDNSFPDLSLQLRRNSRDSRETSSYMDFAQGIDSDIEETTTTTTTLVQQSQTTTSITVTESNPINISSPSGGAASMDPPSPILPPPPGSISPPRFLNEDFDIRDDDLPTNLNASELLMEPPPSSSSRADESSAEDDDEDDDDQDTIVQNKLKATQFHGLDSLTSDMAATLQSMISEEIEETIPKDSEEEVVQWSSDTITSPPPPVWRQATEEEKVVVTSAGGAGSLDEEEEEESSPNSQSPQQVHKIISPPPPPAAREEEDDEDVSLPEKCGSVVSPVPAPPPAHRADDDEPISLASYSSASLPPPLDATSAEDGDEEAAKQVIQSPLPPPLATETAEERELLRKLMDDNEDAELLRQLQRDDDDDDLPLPGRMCGLAKGLNSPPAIVVENKRESIVSDTEKDYTKEEEDDEDVLAIHPTAEQLPKYSEREEAEQQQVTAPRSLRDSLVSSEKDAAEDNNKLVEESEPEDEEDEPAAPPPKIQEMIPKTISIPEKIQSPVKEEEEQEIKAESPIKSPEPEIVKEVKPPSPVKSPSPPPPAVVKAPEPEPVIEEAKKEVQVEDVKPVIEEEKKDLSKITSPKGTRLDDYRKPYIPAYTSSLVSNKPPSYTSTVYTQPGTITALNDRTRPVYMTDDRRQRYSSPSSSLREQFFSSSSATSTTNTSSGAGSAPAKPPLTQTSVGGGSAGGMSSEEQKSSSARVETSSVSKTEVIRQSHQQQKTITTQQQQTITTSSTSAQSSQQQQRQTNGNNNNRQSGQSQISSRRSQELSETGAATSRGGGGGKQPSTPGSTGGDLEKGLVTAAAAASSGENGDPQGRLPDVSSIAKMANDIECQSACSKVVKAGDVCSLTFSAIYSKLIIVLGISLPLVEVISPHHIPVLAYQGFYLYLYGVGILFLLFMFFSMCCCSRKPPSASGISPSTSATSQSEAAGSKASGSKSKKAKSIDSPQTPQEELQKRVDEAAAVAAAAAAAAQAQNNQDANGAGGELNEATSTTNILTASPTAGANAEVRKASARKISHTFSDDGLAPRFKYGSYFLRVGAILFGLASIIYSALEFGQYFECKHLILTLTPGVRTLFILLQLYFIFLNNDKITFYPFKLIARVGLMHLIGTNLALWINVLIHETNNEFSYSGQVQNITVWTQEALSGQVKWNMSGWNFEWQEMMADCPRTNLIGKLVQMASPYLFPCCIQYALICSVILYFMWRNVGRHPAAPIGVLQQHSSISCSFRTFDCRQSYKGLFLGVIILASAIASVAAFFVLLTKDTFEKLAFTQLTLCELGLYAVTMIAILFGTFRMRKLQYDGARRFHLDEYLLIGAQIGLFLYSTLAILGTEFNLQPETIFTWVTAILSILQTVCQTMFVLDAYRRTSNSIEQSRYRPGREFVVFLLIANLALWILSIFQKSRPSTNPVPLEFYGVWAWTVITHLWSPLAIFYRFHSTVCLIEVSKRAYKIKPTFM